MICPSPSKSSGDILRDFGFTLVFCVGIALFLTMVGLWGDFVENLAVSLSIGLIIHSLALLTDRLLYEQADAVRWLGVAVAIVAGSALGLVVGFWIIDIDTVVSAEMLSKTFYSSMPLGLLFGGLIAWFYYSRNRLAQARSEAMEKELMGAAREKELIQAQLKLLQAQIEPHFLFNTLANVHSLIESEPKLASTMLENLNSYLRESLDQSRAGASTLQREADLIRAYLDIHKVRMADRLRYRIAIDPAVALAPFPPMLLQPLVENAIKHGLEPKSEGGEVLITARPDGDALHIEVADNGVGLKPGNISGVGLDNVRQRITSLYGAGGGMDIITGQRQGLTVCLRIPVENQL